MAWKGVITNGGSELLAQWTAGKTLTVTRAAAGTGRVDEAAMLAQTALAEEKQSASILANRTTEQGQKMQVQVTPQTTGYALNQIGVWAKLDEGEAKMIALFQTDTDAGVEIPSKADVPDFAYTFYGLLEFNGSGGALQVTIDPSALVTHEDLEEALAQLDAGDIAGAVRYDAAQSLTDGQKTQARANIGALALVTGNINLYVSPSGNDDTGDGSSARPYRTIQHAVDAIPPVLNGHLIRIDVSPGTYEEDVRIVGKAGMSGYRPVEIRGASDLDGAESYQIKSLYVAGVGMGTIAIKGFKFLGNTTDGFDVYSYGNAAIRVDSCIMDAANDSGVSFNDRPFAIAQIVDSTISNKKIAAVRAEHGCIALVRGCTGSNNAVAFAAGYNSGFGGCIVDCGSNSISATTAELKQYGGQIFK